MSSRSFRVARSATGLGLFATKPIKRAGYIATYRGRRISTEEAYRRERRGSKYMFELDDRWVIDGSPRWNVDAPATIGRDVAGPFDRLRREQAEARRRAGDAKGA